MKKSNSHYHHGHLAESLLDAVDEIATQFGIEAVTLRGCAKRIGVSPASAFRHYADKRSLLTVFATRALNQLADSMEASMLKAQESGEDALQAVCMAYVHFALTKPAFFRAMWREEMIYSGDPDYLAATQRLAGYLQEGFLKTIADEDPCDFSPQELLAWSTVHGLACLFVDGPVAQEKSTEEKMGLAKTVLTQLTPVFTQQRS
ncbi:MAG: TetR/AcrR family transcriptional regulator [Candidatus Thiodiazotropha sp.]